MDAETSNAYEIFYQSILDAIPVPIFFKDAHGIYIGCNQAFLTVLGLKKEQVIGKTLYEIAPKELAEKYHSMDMELFTYPGQQIYENPVKYADGSFHDICFHKATFSQKDGTVGGLVGIMFDITKRKQDERDLQENYQRYQALIHQLEHALQNLKTTQQQLIQQERLHALGRMASGIAHDFNNSLTPIIGFSDLLLTMPGYLQDTNRSREYIKRIKLAAQDAANIVKRLRAFYRRQPEDEVLQLVDINAIVQEAIFLTEPKWKSQPELIGKQIQIITELNELPKFLSNPSELREVLVNLIFNAVDAIPNDGTIHIKTSKKEDWIVLEVIDTGIGMSLATKEKCIQPFFTTKGEKGSGLGLTIVNNIIHHHNGKLEVESQPNQGSHFIVYLPIVQHEKEIAEKNIPLFEQPLKILLVDDDPKICGVLQAYLEADQHILTIAPDSYTALQKLQSENFDVVICEYTVKKMNGEELAAKIKQEYKNIPVIVITGFSETIFVPSISHIDCLLQRPLSFQQMRQALFTVISQKK